MFAEGRVVDRELGLVAIDGHGSGVAIDCDGDLLAGVARVSEGKLGLQSVGAAIGLAACLEGNQISAWDAAAAVTSHAHRQQLVYPADLSYWGINRFGLLLKETGPAIPAEGPVIGKVQRTEPSAALTATNLPFTPKEKNVPKTITLPSGDTVGASGKLSPATPSFSHRF